MEGERAPGTDGGVATERRGEGRAAGILGALVAGRSGVGLIVLIFSIKGSLRSD